MKAGSSESPVVAPRGSPDAPTLHLMWNSQFETGIEVIDRQHRDLVDRVNLIAPLLARAGDQIPEGLGNLFDQLHGYAEAHFATEESLMKKRGVDPRHVAQQKESHRRFSAEVTRLTSAYLNRRGLSGRELLGFLTNWLVFHILGEDQVLAQQLQSISAGATPEHAFEVASSLAIDPARQALGHVITDMYAQFSNMAGQQEANIDELELRNKIIADHTYDWETWHGPDGQLRYCSPACLRISGYEAKNYFENADLLRAITHPEDVSSLENHLKGGDADTGWHEITLRIRHADGRWRWLDHDCQPVFDNTGNFQGYRASIRDVTDRIEMARQLRDALSRAENAAQAKSDFLSNMSHEIRTPLNAIIASSLLMLKDIQEPVQRQRLQRMASSSQHLLALISDILDMAKIEAGKIKVEKSPFLLTNIVDMVTNQVEERLRAKGIEWHVDVDPKLPERLLGDPLRLGQILVNFASNAVKFTESGAVTLIAEKLGESSIGLRIRFAVHDTGCGFDPVNAAHIFLPFEQEDGSTTRKHGGTGLGLAICQQLASLMDGTVGAESQPGQGSTFWFEVTLPAAIDPRSPANSASLHGRRAILIGRDNNAVDLTSQMLGLHGIHIQQAETVPELLMRLEVAMEVHRPFDFVICVGYGVFLFELLEADVMTHLSTSTLETHRTYWLWACGVGDKSTVSDNAHFFDAILPLPGEADDVAETLRGLLSGAATEKRCGELSDTPNTAVADLSSYARYKLLLVEDNEINQEVMLDILSAVGLQADVAEDGRVALAMVCEKHYDLILMDMQMPVMGGVEATQAIRRLAGYQHTPILALTANAFASDRQSCLDAGMNDHVVKPVLPDILYAALRQWLPPPPSAATGYMAASPIDQENGSDFPGTLDIVLPALAGLDVAKGLARLQGKRAFYRKLLELLVHDHLHDPVAIREDLRAGGFAEARRRAHSLKGAAAMLGAEAIRSTAARMELLLIGQDLPDLSINALEIELSSLTQALSELSQALAATAPAVPAIAS